MMRPSRDEQSSGGKGAFGGAICPGERGGGNEGGGSEGGGEGGGGEGGGGDGGDGGGQISAPTFVSPANCCLLPPDDDLPKPSVKLDLSE